MTVASDNLIAAINRQSVAIPQATAALATLIAQNADLKAQLAALQTDPQQTALIASLRAQIADLQQQLSAANIEAQLASAASTLDTNLAQMQTAMAPILPPAS